LVLTNPIELFQTWLQEAVDSGIKEPTAMSVATVDAEGAPEARMLLLKGCDDRGFVFYTNLESAKGEALRNDPRVALCFFWDAIEKQVRIRGRVSPVNDGEADAYFATRPRLSQLSAWASKQSRTMEDHFELETEIAKAAVRFGVGRIPRPSFWSGFRVAPEQIEFWHGKPYRRHHRIRYTRTDGSWSAKYLYP
jgi:pyridoxamine 5'-phosphate oxidase